MNRSSALGLCALALLCGCSASGASHSIVVGTDGNGGASNGQENGGSTAVQVGDGSVLAPLSAQIEDARGVTVTFVTLSCSDACADVVAVAKGGFEPYAFKWENGSTNPRRTVCPSSTTSYSVTVTDAGVSSPEFSRPPDTVTVPLSARVIACPVGDGGVDSGVAALGPCDSLANSFSPKGVNPSGAWSYGWSNGVGGAFTSYPTFVAQDLTATAYSGLGFPLIAQWFDKSIGVVSETGPVPDIQFNPSATTVYPGTGNFSGSSWLVGPGKVVMAPVNLGTQSSVARWTAPSAGLYAARATFASAAAPGYSQTADVHVQHNGVDLTGGAGSITTAALTFSVDAHVMVARGDTVDFVVAGPGSIIYHMISVDAEVCAVLGE
jgi:hypothetical protein